MDPFEIVRRRASAIRHLAALDSRLSAFEVALRLAERQGYDAIPRQAEDPLLQGAEAVLDRGVEAIFYRGSAPRPEAATLIAHEIGHLVLHAGLSLCSAQDVAGGGLADAENEADGPSAIHRLDSYGARERQELQANVFARELLLPRTMARDLFLEQNLGASDIGERWGLPLELVRQQLCDALLLPLEPDAPEEAPDGSRAAVAVALDPSQRAAAEHIGTPLLLEAGPGTGKTRTLVARILHLIDQGVEPASILALTFSNKAAQEIVDRVSAKLADTAPRLFAGTFHAFGLEILRKHHDRVGLTPELRVVDRADAVALLEDRLPALDLVHHQNLYEPALELKEMLAAISRAKDELVDAAGYARLAEKMAVQAEDDKSRKAAEKAQEVARVYAEYEKVLGRKGWVDFGDLVMMPTLMLEREPALRVKMRLRYRHILVDEYQDVNRASARMLKALAGDGRRLWVVGDSRQSIYRFRGASTANMRLFSRDFPSAKRRALATSYRSTPEVVDTFCHFARSMKASEGMLPLELTARKDAAGEAGRPVLVQVDAADREMPAVAARVRRLLDEGVPLRQQAVLCRSNAQMEKFALGFQARGLPVLHLGSLFERSEVRDLLSLLSLVVDPRGGALGRVAAMPAYGVATQDVELFLSAVRARDAPDAADGPSTKDAVAAPPPALWTPLELLHRLAGLSTPEEPGDASSRDPVSALRADLQARWLRHLDDLLSPGGKRGLIRLAGDLASAHPTSGAWQLLADYLLDRSDALRRVSLDGSMEDRLRSAALHQFLSFVKSARGTGKGYPAKRLLERVRRLMLLGDERDLRRLPAAALHLDAVRLMTLHGSKGLEFEAVHLPSLSAGGLPAPYRESRCPPPPGLIAGLEKESNGERELHLAEEECLFFVAMSRARSRLCLYQPLTRGSRRCAASTFLERLGVDPGADIEASMLRLESAGSSIVVGAEPRGKSFGGAKDKVLEESLQEPLPGVRGRDLRAYERCPRKFFYGRVLGLPGQRGDGAYRKMRDCLYRLIRHLRQAGPQAATAEEVSALCDRLWRRHGPTGHAVESRYRDLLSTLVDHLLNARGELQMAASMDAAGEDPSSLVLGLNGHRVRLEADLMGLDASGAPVIRLFHTGRKGSSFRAEEVLHALWQQAAQEHFGDDAKVEVVHLADGERTPVELTRRKLEFRLGKGEELLGRLADGKFPTALGRQCARCPYFFVCPTRPEGPLRARPLGE